MPCVRLETFLAGASPADCFALSLSVDAHTASMGASRERAVAGVAAGEMDVDRWVLEGYMACLLRARNAWLASALTA